MDLAEWQLVGTILLGGVAFAGFFRTKEAGYGRFNTSLLLIMTITFLAALLTLGKSVPNDLFGHVVFGVLGFAGGLFVGK